MTDERWSKDDVGSGSMGDQWAPREHLGELTLFLAPEAEEIPAYSGDGFQTVADCRAVIVLSGENEGDIYDDARVFGALGASIARDAEQGLPFAAGRVSQGPAKPGQSPPFILEEADEEDMETVLAFLNEHVMKDGKGRPVLNPT